MIRRETWALLAVFAVLLAISLGLRQRQQNLPTETDTAANPSPTPLPALYDVDPGVLATRIVLEEPIGEQRRVVLERVATPTPTPETLPTPAEVTGTVTPTPTPAPMWIVREPEGAKAPQDWEIDSAVQSLLTARVLAVLPDDTDPKTLGLAKPHRAVHITLADGTTLHLFVGITTPLQNGYYVQTQEGGPIFVVSDFVVDGLWDLFTQVYESLVTPTPTTSSDNS
ncbi:MAG: DUF4340 domain-containing protein [Chloroflexi bacterium]|nr:DUF4340 domain-containing protein [Chloroflexota bacterium]